MNKAPKLLYFIDATSRTSGLWKPDVVLNPDEEDQKKHKKVLVGYPTVLEAFMAFREYLGDHWNAKHQSVNLQVYSMDTIVREKSQLISWTDMIEHDVTPDPDMLRGFGFTIPKYVNRLAWVKMKNPKNSKVNLDIYGRNPDNDEPTYMITLGDIEIAHKFGKWSARNKTELIERHFNPNNVSLDFDILFDTGRVSD